MSRNAVCHRDNGKVPRDSVVIPEKSPRHRGSLKTNLQVPSSDYKSIKCSRTAFCRHSMIITMRLNRDEEDKELFDYKSDRRRRNYLLICTNCLRKTFVFQLTQHQWKASSNKWIIHAATQCMRVMGNKAIK